MSLATITLNIDTHQVVKDLLSMGHAKDQAEGFVDAIREINLAGGATKNDVDQSHANSSVEIAKFRVETAEAITKLRIETTEGFSNLRVESYRTLMIQAVGIIGLTVTFIRLMPNF